MIRCALLAFSIAIYALKSTCENSKWQENGSLSHMHASHPCSVVLTWYVLDCLDWSMYLRQVHTRAGITWRVHDDKELFALSVPPFRRLSSLRHFVPFTLSFDEEKYWKYIFYLQNWTMNISMLLSSWGVYWLHGNWYSPKVWPCIWSQITPNSQGSVNSQDKKTVVCGNYYNMLFITLRATTASFVHVQALFLTMLYQS